MDQAAIEALIEPTLAQMGYALVRLRLYGAPNPTLQVMAEKADGGDIGLEDCEAISRALSAKLDVEDPIASAYTLEVSSPGIDRPLVRPADYARFAGFVARIETKRPVAERRRFSGRILKATETEVRIKLEDGEQAEVDIPIADIARAKLKLTDELLAAASRH